MEDRRTKHKIHAHRTIDERVEIPSGAILRNVARVDAWQPIPEGIRDLVERGNINFHAFEYNGETLFVPFGDGLMGATEPITIYSFWTGGRDGRLAVSKNRTLPGPVAGYVVQNEDRTWCIEGDETRRSYPTLEQAAEALLKRDAH